jgi:hypothetical protein
MSRSLVLRPVVVVVSRSEPNVASLTGSRSGSMGLRGIAIVCRRPRPSRIGRLIRIRDLRTESLATSPPVRGEKMAEEERCDFLFDGLHYPGSPVVLDVIVRCELVLGHPGPHFGGKAADGTWFT